MRPMFTRMKPDLDNMVTQTNRPNDTQILCVECEWQSSVANPQTAALTFKLHPCRLITNSISTLD